MFLEFFKSNHLDVEADIFECAHKGPQNSICKAKYIVFFKQLRKSALQHKCLD